MGPAEARAMRGPGAAGVGSEEEPGPIDAQANAPTCSMTCGAQVAENRNTRH